MQRRLVAAVVLTGSVAAGLASLLTSRPAPVASSAPAQPTAATKDDASRPPWLRPVPPAVFLPPGDDIDEALRPWQAGNYAGAAMWLEALADAQPEIPMLHFYAGAGWLLSGVPADAAAALEHATTHIPAEHRGEAAWYLGLARLELGNTEAARRAFDDACSHGIERGCRATAHLDKAADQRRTSLTQTGRLR